MTLDPTTPEADAAAARPFATFSLERTARIAASIDVDPASAPSILDANQLDEGAWKALRSHWLDELAADARRGTHGRLRVQDAAYVARLEEERGPIEPAEYARIVVAAERGTLATVLDELGIPAAAQIPVERVWLERTITDPAVAQAVKTGIRAARLG